MKEGSNIKYKIEMSNRITRTSEEILNSIKTNNIDEFRETLQLFIIQFELYREQIGENNGR
ncbi:MAG: hypothetical protein CL842_12840 [Crocinitomicaceae bacterium]|nr:hypothetical protein [Crocinitomicaceae bacterium]|tara:strand:- start:173 stop:355 length:183 start_codon:yes stop_codon:yes gene_type:complete